MSEASRALPEQPAARGEAETVTWANTREVRWIFFGFLRSCLSLGGKQLVDKEHQVRPMSSMNSPGFAIAVFLCGSNLAWLKQGHQRRPCMAESAMSTNLEALSGSVSREPERDTWNRYGWVSHGPGQVRNVSLNLQRSIPWFVQRSSPRSSHPERNNLKLPEFLLGNSSSVFAWCRSKKWAKMSGWRLKFLLKLETAETMMLIFLMSCLFQIARQASSLRQLSLRAFFVRRRPGVRCPIASL